MSGQKKVSSIGIPTPLLLDTCAAIWLMDGSPLSAASRSALQAARKAGMGIHLSPFTSWEIGMLVQRGKLTLTMTAQDWFEQLTSLPGIRLAELSPKVLIESTMILRSALPDPADRIMAATARSNGFTLVTRDAKLLDYAREGYIRAIRC